MSGLAAGSGRRGRAARYWRRLAPAVLAAAALCMPTAALALDGNDELTLTLVGGASLTGWFVGVDQGVLRVSGDNRFTDVALDQVLAVRRDGEEMALQDFLVEAAEAQARLEALRADPPSTPPPALVGGASMLYAGAGHAALGEWKGAATWALVDSVILSAAAYNLFVEDSIPAAIPVLALDLLIKGAAAGDAARIARRRRRLLEGPLGD